MQLEIMLMSEPVWTHNREHMLSPWYGKLNESVGSKIYDRYCKGERGGDVKKGRWQPLLISYYLVLQSCIVFIVWFGLGFILFCFVRFYLTKCLMIWAAILKIRYSANKTNSTYNLDTFM